MKTNRLKKSPISCLGSNDRYSHKRNLLNEELIGLGMSVGKKDDKTLKVKAVYKFAASGAARSEYTLDKIKDDLTAMNLPSIKVKCFEPEAIPKEKFVEATASMYITDFSYFGLDQ